MIRVLYFARLRERLGRSEESIALPDGVDTVAALSKYLRQRGGAWEGELAAGKSLRIAVNQQMATIETAIKSGDEIAFFPPVTGG